MSVQARARRAAGTPRVDRAAGAPRSLHDLPERVLPADPAAGELEEVAPADLDRLAGPLRAADRPLRDAAVPADPVAVVAVVDIGDAVEARLDPRPDLIATHQPPPSRPGPARHVEHAVLGEEGHD